MVYRGCDVQVPQHHHLTPDSAHQAPDRLATPGQLRFTLSRVNEQRLFRTFKLSQVRSNSPTNQWHPLRRAPITTSISHSNRNILSVSPASITCTFRTPARTQSHARMHSCPPTTHTYVPSPRLQYAGRYAGLKQETIRTFFEDMVDPRGVRLTSIPTLVRRAGVSVCVRGGTG